ncbi:uncharacterized protein [Halyomorpha halys]|uniref:uncharacterized protein n=1 Tax=Halyomorpha halys TaxID=286706 RepID=UPI0006D5137A|nr:uncharacterized protein LOC106684810 [Halyomorpha halys]XP_014282590.1 uncharacterized protein LOC106684810 [Halyomorpha halys]
MSRNSPSTRQLLAAGLVGVGVGVLAVGVGYAIATSSPTSSQYSERSVERLENRFDGESTKINMMCDVSDRCKICGVDMSSEPSVSLSCNHSFHKKCLFSNYVVQTQVNKGSTFRCPYKTCKDEISDKVVESLFALH